MFSDEGYIKFNPIWDKTPPLSKEALVPLNKWRNKLYDLKLIGAYENGIGYGNVSCRTKGDQFIITGSATGNIKRLGASHYALVTGLDIAQNTLHCEGPIIASSESMSHAVIYGECPEINAVFHIHSLELWERLLFKIPTTSADATYGSPEMAYEIIRILREEKVRQNGVFVMAGHREGIISFGKSLEEAGEKILDL